MTGHDSIPCYHCNISNQHLCIYCNGTGWIQRGEGNVIGWVITLAILIPIAVTSAISALVIAIILKLYVQSIEPKSPELTFGKAFKLLFTTTVLYQSISLLIGLIIYFLVKQNVDIPLVNFQVPDQSAFYKTIFASFLFCHIPTILLTGIMLRNKLSGYAKFKRFSGYLRATLFTGIIIFPLVQVTGFLIMALISFYVFKQPITLFH